MNWKLGPQLCRDPSKGEVELLATELFPSFQEGWADLMPPKMSKKEAFDECEIVFMQSRGPANEALRAALDHYDILRREGRVEGE